MKLRNWCVGALLMVFVAVVGCGKSDNVDTSKMEQSFASSEPDVKSEADKVIAAIKAKDWAGAQAKLQDLAYNAKLTDAQKQAVMDTVEQVKKMVTEAVDKAKEGATKAVEDMKNALPK